MLGEAVVAAYKEGWEVVKRLWCLSEEDRGRGE